MNGKRYQGNTLLLLFGIESEIQYILEIFGCSL